MPRSRHSDPNALTRMQGAFSAVTFQTNPSGVSIYKDTIQASNLLNSAGASGYVLPFATATGKKLVAGQVACAGTSKDRQTLGLSAINYCLATLGVTRASTVSGYVIVTTAKGSIFPSAGVTEVCFYTYKSTGAAGQPVALGKACSIQYFAIGS